MTNEAEMMREALEPCPKCGAALTYEELLSYEERILAAEMDAIQARRALDEARELARADKDRRIEIALKMLVARWPVAIQLSPQGQTAIVNAMEDFAQALTAWNTRAERVGVEASSPSAEVAEEPVPTDPDEAAGWRSHRSVVGFSECRFKGERKVAWERGWKARQDWKRLSRRPPARNRP